MGGTFYDEVLRRLLGDGPPPDEEDTPAGLPPEEPVLDRSRGASEGQQVPAGSPGEFFKVFEGPTVGPSLPPGSEGDVYVIIARRWDGGIDVEGRGTLPHGRVTVFGALSCCAACAYLGASGPGMEVLTVLPAEDFAMTMREVAEDTRRIGQDCGLVFVGCRAGHD